MMLIKNPHKRAVMLLVRLIFGASSPKNNSVPIITKVRSWIITGILPEFDLLNSYRKVFL